MGKRELVALLNLSSWCLVMVERLFLMVPQGCLQFVIVVFPDHTHYFVSRYESRYTTNLNNRCACGRGIFSEQTLFNIKGQLNVMLA